MTLACSLSVKLEIKGPFLCSATGQAAWGVDAVFHKNAEGNHCIPKSHVKGRLREAWDLFNRAGAYKPEINIDDLLGKKTDEEDRYLPKPGRLAVSDFVCGKDDKKRLKIHRIRIEPVTGTAEEHALFSCETPFASGSETQWEGEISFVAESEGESESIRKLIIAGFRWISALGAEKGVGFGRLCSVKVAEKSRTPIETVKIGASGAARKHRLAIFPQEPIAVGGKKIKDNYMTSVKVLSGGVIKGSLARCIRNRAGLPENAPIESCEKLDAIGLSFLAKYFEFIRFTHGFPSVSDERPTMPPHSVAEFGKETGDMALEDGPTIRPNPAGTFIPPNFRIGWKDNDLSKLFKAYGWAEPRITALTRTAIDRETQRALEEKLYTFEYICPADNTGKPVTWLSHAFLPDLGEDLRKLCGEIEYVMEHWFDHAGKRAGKIRAEIEPGEWVSSKPSGDILKNGLTVVSLQTDAMILNPDEIKNGGEVEIAERYKDFWKSDNVSKGAYEMIRHFAVHDLKGGYMGKRFRTKGAYRPFLMTSAGSVFVLKAIRPDHAKAACESWMRDGLPPPAWSLDLYGREGVDSLPAEGGRLDWKKCPYIRENGFGEIAVNLPCHWNQRRTS